MRPTLTLDQNEIGEVGSNLLSQPVGRITDVTRASKRRHSPLHQQKVKRHQDQQQSVHSQ